LLAPHLAAAAARGVRLVGVARPGFGGSSRLFDRTVAEAAADVVHVADRLDIGRFAVMGYSGGGPHALAAGGQAGSRAVGIATFGSPAPFSEDGSWFDGMRDPGALRSARHSRAAREEWERTASFEPEQFIADDYAALDGPLVSLAEEVGRASDLDAGGSVDDDLALVGPWGVDLATITAQVQILHGVQDRVVPFAHAARINRLCRSAKVIPLSGRGHVGVLLAWETALDRMLAAIDRTP
jgi:pimeloyl-ACP methyl ester carboxylesterase